MQADRVKHRRTGVSHVILLGTALLGLLVPASAAASSVGMKNGALFYAGASGEANDVVVWREGDNYIFTDTQQIAAGPGCMTSSRADAVGGGYTAVCSALGVWIGNLDAGDGDDTITDSTATGLILRGGAGVDRIDAGAGDDYLDGGDDADTLNGGDGDDSLDGGAGPDALVGQAGTDRAKYSMRASAVGVTLDGLANDGSSSEADNVQTEAVEGGWGNDVLTGDEGDNRLYGAIGDDTLTGGGGDDYLEGSFEDDVLEGGAGVDDVRGNSGADSIRSRDSVADAVDCGSEADTVAADLLDTTTADCEQVDRAAVEDGTTPPPDGTTPPPDGTTPPPDGTTPPPDPGDPSPIDPTPPTNGPRLAIPSRVVVVGNAGVVRVRVACPASARGRCRGVVTLALIPRAGHAAEVGISRRSRPKPRPTRVGRKRFSLPRGRTTLLGIRISRHGRKVLRTRRRVPARVSMVGREGSARPKRSTRPVTLRAARKSRPARIGRRRGR